MNKTANKTTKAKPIKKSVVSKVANSKTKAVVKPKIVAKKVVSKAAVVKKASASAVVSKKTIASKNIKKTVATEITAKVSRKSDAGANNSTLTKLTDEMILNMPESQYMCQLQLEFFRAKLIENEQEILENAKKTTQAFQEQETNYIADPSDRATIEEEYALELRTRDRERKLLQKIRKALHMIDAGGYGYCEDTGEPIGLKRLIARPTATLTIEAQERREKLQKHYADE